VERRSTQAAAALRAGIAELGLSMIPLAEAHRAHIVSVGDALGAGHDSTETAWIQSLSDHLREAGVVHSVRRGILRLATHVHALPEMTATALAEMERWRRRAA